MIRQLGWGAYCAKAAASYLTVKPYPFSSHLFLKQCITVYQLNLDFLKKSIRQGYEDMSFTTENLRLDRERLKDQRKERH